MAIDLPPIDFDLVQKQFRTEIQRSAPSKSPTLSRIIQALDLQTEEGREKGYVKCYSKGHSKNHGQGCYARLAPTPGEQPEDKF